MALHFMICVECGPDAARAKAVSDHLDNHPIAEGCVAQAWAWKDSEGNHWAEANPSGTVGHELSAATRTALGFALYARLRTAPPFRYALVGLQTEEFRLRSELEPSDVGLIDGLVLSDALHAELGSPGGVEPFAPGYVWHPWQGDDWGA